ncbi:MAG: hypothetical protein V4447_10645 [Pseudomonadota bacterium]
MKKILGIAFLTISSIAFAAGTTINPAVPAANSNLASAPIRANFAAAANDVNALIMQNGSATAPLSPLLGQLWLNTTTTPYVLNEWDGGAWVAQGQLNASTHTWTIPTSAGGTGLNTAGTNGYVLTSNGSTWFAAPPSTGSVSTVSVSSANGFTGSVANPTSTPAISIATSVSGILKGAAGSLATANSGIDYAPGTSGLSTGILKTTTGTGALSTAVVADFPTLNQNTTGNAATVTTNANLSGDVTSVGNVTTLPVVNTAGSYGTVTTNAKGQVTSGLVVTPVSNGGSGVANISGVIRGNGTAAFSAAAAGTDFAPATTGTSILYGNSAGGFSNATVGNGLSFSAGTLSSNTQMASTTSVMSVASTTVLANIPGLSITVSAGGTYEFEAHLYVTSAIAGGVKVASSGTATATSFISSTMLYANGMTIVPTTGTSQVSVFGNPTGVTAVADTILIYGTIIVNAGGTFTIQFAQNASLVTASTVLANSSLRVIRVL